LRDQHFRQKLDTDLPFGELSKEEPCGSLSRKSLASFEPAFAKSSTTSVLELRTEGASKAAPVLPNRSAPDPNARPNALKTASGR
jgi:hypothetical protein